MASWQHRAVLHSSFGMVLAESVFGLYITNSDGKRVAVRDIAYHHIMEDLGRVPSLQDWMTHLQPQKWMFPSKNNTFPEEL